MYKPLVSILGDFYENRFLFIEALYVALEINNTTSFVYEP